ncbi:MAG: endonuclease III [Candidatus Nealsonbacteria bacterium]|nr:MAG: endonuclease III [Candidatus Nealsonbacteria bacterium]
MIQKTEILIKLLRKEYPSVKLALNFSNPLELLIATILSAQCTDERINRVTKNLFKKYRNVRDYAKADLKIFGEDIKATGFYKNKAKNIIAACQKIIEKFKGKVPRKMEEITILPGVGRKTANIVLTFAFKRIEGIAVDTHVRRLSKRLGLSKNDDPNKIEQDLIKIIPKKDWGNFSCLLIEHGRNVCLAKKPLCRECILKNICPSFNYFIK